MLVVLVIIAVLVLVLLPGLQPPRVSSSRIRCVVHLKQIGLAFRVFATDNGDRLPWEVPVSEGGSGTNLWLDPDHTYRHFLVISNELGGVAGPLICPADRTRFVTTTNTFADRLNPASPNAYNLGVSYFLNLSANETNPTQILGGDRHIKIGRAHV